MREGDHEHSLVNEDLIIEDEDSQGDDSNLSLTTDYSKYNKMCFSLTNARSLPPKISALTTAFRELNLDFIMVTETWIKNSRMTARNIKDYKDAENIDIICKNRRTRGGGVCVAFDNKRAKFQRFPLPSSEMEVVCAAGKVAGFSRKIAVVCVYLPPKYNAQQVSQLEDYLAECLEKIAKELNDPYVCVGGDFNNRCIDGAFRNFPDVKALPNIPSRRGAALDVCYVNFSEDVFKLSSHPPLATPLGVESDHLILSYDFKIPKKHVFTTAVRKARRFGQEDLEGFRAALVDNDWSGLNDKSSSGMVEEFDRILAQHYETFFPEYEVKTRSTDLPWISRRIKRRIRQKKRLYRRKGKNREWREFERSVEQDINENQKRHMQKVKKRVLEQKNSSAYHATVKLLASGLPKKRWTPAEVFPELSEQEVSEKCADFFNGISSEFEQITEPAGMPQGGLLVPPEPFQIAGRLRSMRKPKGIVPGDIDYRVVNFCSDVLAFPLAKIYGQVYRLCQWPDSWKLETVTIIPKNSAPSTLAETRNISCTPLFSKLLEAFVLDELRKQVKLNSTQFGGIKGLGVDHFLVETWDEILRAMDSGGKVVNLMSIDFQKAFNRMDHSTCLERLKFKGAQDHLVQLVAAFLFGRKMTVKTGEARSVPRTVSGGAPQGSLLGPFLFCVVSEILAETVTDTDLDRVTDTGEPSTQLPSDSMTDSESEGTDDEHGTSEGEWAEVEADFNFFRRRRVNPLDDTVFSEPPEWGEENEDFNPQPTVKAYIDDFNIIEVLDEKSGSRHLTTRKTKNNIHAKRSGLIFDEISKKAKDMKMLVNAKKTQMLCVGQNSATEANTYICTDSSRISSNTELKILGFVFSEKPTCRAQIDYLIAKFRTRLWSLRKLAARGMDKCDLLIFYIVNMRSVLEYTQVTYHSMLSREQAGNIERAQALALKIIYGAKKSYSTLREEAKVETMEKRRTEAFRKFSVKCSKNEVIKNKWLPENFETGYNTRRRNNYLEETARTEKLHKSPIFEMRRYLNTI